MTACFDPSFGSLSDRLGGQFILAVDKSEWLVLELWGKSSWYPLTKGLGRQHNWF
jgi:hypothetical protein